MAQRVATGRIVVGSGEARRVIQPGQRFNTEDFGLDDAELKKLDVMNPPLVRRRRDDAPVARAEPEAEVVEDEEEEAAAAAAAAADKPRRGRKPKASEDLDL